jgi:hypothetical protein
MGVIAVRLRCIPEPTYARDNEQFYSITSSARESSGGETGMPSALAVFRLIAAAPPWSGTRPAGR